MGHSKLPWTGRNSPVPHIVRVYKDEQGRTCIQCIVGEMNTAKNVDGQANRDLIVTAVNVMPKVIDFIMGIVDKDFDYDTSAEANALLKKLEAVDGS